MKREDQLESRASRADGREVVAWLWVEEWFVGGGWSPGLFEDGINEMIQIKSQFRGSGGLGGSNGRN